MYAFKVAAAAMALLGGGVLAKITEPVTVKGNGASAVADTPGSLDWLDMDISLTR